jgi:hypothetical protein
MGYFRGYGDIRFRLSERIPKKARIEDIKGVLKKFSKKPFKSSQNRNYPPLEVHWNRVYIELSRQVPAGTCHPQIPPTFDKWLKTVSRGDP